MNNTRMITIAKELAALLEKQTYNFMMKSDMERVIEARKLALTPDDGWPGKNAENRELAAMKTFAADPDIAKWTAALVDHNHELSIISWKLEALRDERRALEWGVKSDLVNVLAHRNIQAEPNGEFDGTLEQAVEQAAWASIPVADNGPVWDTDEAPF